MPNFRLLRWKLRRGRAALLQAPSVTVWRLLTWQARRRLRRSVTISLRRWNLRLSLPTDWAVGATMIYVFRERYEPELIWLERFLEPGAVVVDAGANLGIYSVVAARLVGPTGRVYAFEPGQRAYELLGDNLGRNDLHRVQTFRAALSDQDGTAQLYERPWGPTSYALSTKEPTVEPSELVPTMTLDSLAREHGLDRLDLLKIDVEGAEELVLRGGRELIARTRPVILFEASEYLPTLFGLAPNGAWEFLAELGYGFHTIERGMELARITRQPVEGNVIAFPLGRTSTLGVG